MRNYVCESLSSIDSFEQVLIRCCKDVDGMKNCWRLTDRHRDRQTSERNRATHREKQSQSNKVCYREREEESKR